MNTSSNITSSVTEVASNYRNATREFLTSNSLISKVAFLLLVLLGFTIILRLGVWILGYLLTDSHSPKLIDGMIDARTTYIIPQDPNMDSSINVSRSTNEREGIEFTWSCWMYINDVTLGQGKYRCVFYKGNDFVSNTATDLLGVNFPNNAPGLYIAPNTNKLVIFMNTFNDINTKIDIDNVPLKKWVNVIMRCQNTLLDIYINGSISKSLKLQGVPKQNFGNVFVAPNGGFDGYISNLWYYDSALTPTQINALVNEGPNTSMIGSKGDGMNLDDADYLSLRWYFNGVGNAYNPPP